MAGRKGKRLSAQVVEDEGYLLRCERVAGIDVAKASGMVCVRLPPGPGRVRRSSRVWEAEASVPGIEAVARELLEAGVELVSMESTSDYWRIWYCVLEEAGLAVQLVSSAQAKNLPGRPKTDKADAQWLARLTEMGLLRACFVPPAQVRALRVYTRELGRLAADRARYWNRMEKLLEDAHCKLSSVTSTLAKNASARLMIEKMIGGESDPRVLADLAMTRLRDKRGALVAAFTGMRFEHHHAVTARGYLIMIDRLDEQAAEVREQARAQLDQIKASWGVDAGGVTGPGAGHGGDAVVMAAVPRLAEVPGISEDLAVALIAEAGLDMTAFPSPGHLVSWAGLAPVADQSGPRRGRGKKGRGNCHLRKLVVQAANGAANTDTFLGARHRRLRSRPGRGGWKKANCAVGRSVLVIVWHLLADPAARYADLGPGHYARHNDTTRKTRNHKRQLEALGYDVTLTPRQAA